MNNPLGIGSLAQAVLDEVKTQNLVKEAEKQIVKTASENRPPKTEVGRALKKIANDLRSKNDEVTVGDVERFYDEVRNAK